MANTITFRPNEANRNEIQRIRDAYSFPGSELTVTEALRVALCVTCRQLDSGHRGGVRVRRSDSVVQSTKAD